MMLKRDIYLSIAAAEVISIFLLPTLINTNSFKKIPLAPLTLFVLYPLVVFFGMYIASILAKRLGFLWQLAKFALVGVLNTSIDFGVYNFLIATTLATKGPGIILINATSFSLALINSFFWNRDWVFGESKKNKFSTFAVVTLIGLLINTGAVFAITTYVNPVLVDTPEVWANIAKLLATGMSLVWNFLGYKLIVFRR